jgi:hypothetical protein
MPDNTPSRNYGRNSRTEGYAHPAHGTPGVLAKSDTDPRNRGRKRSREEIEASSRANYDAKRERLGKLREEVETKKAADKEAKETKRLRVTADKSAAALANNPEAARREVARQQTAAAGEAKRGKPVTRLTAEQQEAGRAANQEANRRAAASRPVDTMHLMSERMKPEGTSLSDTLAASDAAAMPHLVRSIAKSATKYDAPEPAQARDPRARPLETPQPELAAALSSAMKPKKAEPAKQAQSAPTSAATQSAGSAFAEASKANPSMTPSEFFASRPDLVASMQADQGITGAPSMPGPARKPSVKFDAFGNAKPQKLPTPSEAHAYYAATNPQVPGAIPDPFGQTMSYVNTGIDRGLEVGQNIGNAAYETFFAPDKRAEITRAPARDPEVEALRQGSNLAKPMGQGGIAFDPTIRPDYKPEGPNWSPDMASGGSIDKPYDPKKVKTLADWLSGLIPDSFNDPNSMYYFPGKYN